MNHKHGRSADPIYRVWRAMNNRCANPNDTAWKRYGARGITVCDRWRQSFEAFIEDMGERPPGMSLERVDNDKGYTPENVVWASRAQQDANKRSNRLLWYRGEMRPLFVVASLAGMPRDRLSARLRLGMSVEQATDPEFDSYARRRAVARDQADARNQCANGHELTPDNTYLYSASRPVKCCKQCRRENRLRRLGRFAEPEKPGHVVVTLEAA